MSRVHHISEDLIALALTEGTLPHEVLMHCPEMQIDYLRRGLISLDDLTDEQIAIIDDIVFRTEWMPIEHKLKAGYPGSEELTKHLYNGDVAFTNYNGVRHARISDLVKYNLLAEIDYQDYGIDKQEETEQ